MYFTKKTAVTAVALATLGFATAVNAETSVTPYGKINVSLQSTDDGSVDGLELKSNASRFGLKGKSKLSDSLTAIYKLEWEVDTTDEKDTGDNHIKARNQFIGLTGSFGEVIAGRHDTPFKKAQAKVDLFNDLEGDIKHIFAGEVRSDNFFQYSTPSFAGGVKVRVAMMSQGKGAPETNNNDLSDAMSFSLEYSNDNLFVALAQDSDVEGDGTSAKRLTLQYKVGAWTLGTIYNESDNGSYDEEGMLFSAAYKTGDNTWKIQTGESDEKEFGASMTSLGWDHKLGKETKFFAFYTSYDNDANEDKTWIGLGLEQKF